MIKARKRLSLIFEKKSFWVKGGKGVKNGVFEDFLEKECNDFVHFPSERSYYEFTYMCQVSSPGKILFPRYGVKWGQKWGIFWIFCKSNEHIWFVLLQKEGIIRLHVCAKFQVQVTFCSRDMGSKGVKIGVFFDFLKN